MKIRYDLENRQKRVSAKWSFIASVILSFVVLLFQFRQFIPSRACCALAFVGWQNWSESFW